MNKKKREQLKRLDQLDKRLGNTVDKVGIINYTPIKINKKKLAFYMLIPFLAGCLISAIGSFLLVDPFHWYTKSRLPLELQQEKEIKRLQKEFSELILVSELNNTNVIADLVLEVKKQPKIRAIVTSANEIKSITSKKIMSKLTGEDEEIDIKIIVKTVPLEKEINIKLLVSFDNTKLLQQQAEEIARLKQQFADLTLVSKLDKTNTIADLISEIKNHSTIKSIVTTANEIKDVTSKKDDKSKLTFGSEEINIKIIVKTGSLKKEIDIKLSIIFISKKIEQINGLVKSVKFLDDIQKEVKADGINRVSNLIANIKNIIDKNDEYKAAFDGIKFDITNDKEDDEIIASGNKTLNVNFSFTENDKIISSSLTFKVDLQGKSRNDINKLLANILKGYNFNFGAADGFNFILQSTFVDKSTYKDLINELISSAPKINFYLAADTSKEFDNTDSKLNVDFTIDGMSEEKLNEKIPMGYGKWGRGVKLKIYFSVGNGSDKYEAKKSDKFNIIVTKEDYVYKDLFLYRSRLTQALFQDFFKYKAKAKIGSTYGELRAELAKEIERLTKNVDGPKEKYEVKIVIRNMMSIQIDANVISDKNVVNGRFYYATIEILSNKPSITELPPFELFAFMFPVK